MKLITEIVEVLLFPFALCALVFSKKSNSRSLLERLSFGDWVNLRVSSKKRIWLHFASVGEGSGVKPIVARIQKDFPEVELVITTTSLTGKAFAKQLSKSSFLLPIDNPFLMSRIVDKIGPNIFLLFETELWPALIYQIAERQIPSFIINARISDYSFKNYRLFASVFRPILSTFSGIFVQSEKDQRKYLELGVSNEKLQVVGSTKYDFDFSAISKQQRETFFADLGLDREEPCFVAGSVRPEEDEQVILAYLEVKNKYPDLQMIIAPRHPERFTEVAELLSKHGFSFHRRSAGVSSQAQRVVLLDTLGELNLAYSVAHISFVGGTLVDIGGHNPMEPASFAVPVIVGPYTTNIEDVLTSLKAHSAYLKVEDKNALAQMIIKLLADESFYKVSSAGAYQAWQAQQGSTEKVYSAIRKEISE